MTPDQPTTTVFKPFRGLFSVEGRGPVARLDLAPWMVAAPGEELALLREQGGIWGEPALRLALDLEQLGNTYAEELVASLEKGATLSLSFDPAAFDAGVPHHRPNFLPALRIEEANLAFTPAEDSIPTIIAADHPRWEVITDASAWFRTAEAGVIASWAADAFCGGEVS